jgi:hypothetical protein
MGQYRQWLQRREIDQLLRAQLKTFVKELARVDEQISLLANNTLQVDNVIIQTLLKEFQVEASSVFVSDVPVQASLTPLSAAYLLPTDMQTFLETHDPIAPETKKTRRLPNIMHSSYGMSSDGSTSPVDQQSARVDQVVERWFERRTRFAQGTSSNQEEQKESML